MGHQLMGISVARTVFQVVTTMVILRNSNSQEALLEFVCNPAPMLSIAPKKWNPHLHRTPKKKLTTAKIVSEIFVLCFQGPINFHHPNKDPVALPALHALQLSEAPEAWLVPTSQGTQM